MMNLIILGIEKIKEKVMDNKLLKRKEEMIIDYLDFFREELETIDEEDPEEEFFAIKKVIEIYLIDRLYDHIPGYIEDLIFFIGGELEFQEEGEKLDTRRFSVGYAEATDDRKKGKTIIGISRPSFLLPSPTGRMSRIRGIAVVYKYEA